MGLPILLICLTCGTERSPASEQILTAGTPAMLSYLIKDPQLRGEFSAEDSVIRFFAQPEEERSAFAMYRSEWPMWERCFAYLSDDSLVALYERKGDTLWTEADFPILPEARSPFERDSSARLPLQGLRVAIDPGHVAGNQAMAELEGKYVKILPTEEGQDTIRFYEAELTLATAWLIRDELEALGAEVMMTRETAHTGALGIDFFSWKEAHWERHLQEMVAREEMKAEDAQWWRTQAEDDIIYSRHYNRLDLKARAEKINAYQPDLNLMIHFNIHEPNWHNRDEEGYFPQTEANYCMAFVPGSFMEGELNKPIDRLNFARLYFGNDLVNSLTLSDQFVQASIDFTGVPAVTAAEGLPYLERACIAADHPGVYARNLSLTRLIRSPLCYGESLCQENRYESEMLYQRDMEVRGHKVSSRVEAVAMAYIQAVKDFAGM